MYNSIQMVNVFLIKATSYLVNFEYKSFALINLSLGIQPVYVNL